MVATHPFRKMAETEIRVLGLKELPVVFVPHPIGGLRRPQVEEKAAAALSDVVAALTNPRGGGS